MYEKLFIKKKETHYVQEKAKRVFFFGGHKRAFSTHLLHYFFFLSVTFPPPLSNRLTPYYFSRMASILQQEKKKHDIYFIFNSSTSPKTGNIMATLIYISQVSQITFLSPSLPVENFCSNFHSTHTYISEITLAIFMLYESLACIFFKLFLFGITVLLPGIIFCSMRLFNRILLSILHGQVPQLITGQIKYIEASYERGWGWKKKGVTSTL